MRQNLEPEFTAILTRQILNFPDTISDDPKIKIQQISPGVKEQPILAGFLPKFTAAATNALLAATNAAAVHLVKQALISPVKWLDIARAHVVGLRTCFIVFTSAYCLKLVLNCLVVGKGALLHSKSRLTFSLQLLLWYHAKPSTLKTLLPQQQTLDQNPRKPSTGLSHWRMPTSMQTH